MSTVVTQTPVVLDEDSDYIPWLEVIQTAADKFQLWDYVNPKIQPGELKVLEKPVEPTPKSVRTSATTQAEGGAMSLWGTSCYMVLLPSGLRLTLARIMEVKLTR